MTDAEQREAIEYMLDPRPESVCEREMHKSKPLGPKYVRVTFDAETGKATDAETLQHTVCERCGKRDPYMAFWAQAHWEYARHGERVIIERPETMS